MIKNAKHAAILSVIEIGLGSFLHAFRVPFSGQLLSLNQIFILTRASIETQSRTSPALVSTTASLFKSLSPAGKKLTPMLAICAQGQLFTVGTLFFGNNVLGHITGAVLTSLWAYVQPFGIYLILFGKDLIYMIEYFVSKIGKVFSVTQENIISIVLLIILVKVIIALVLVIFAHTISDEQYARYQDWALAQKNKIKESKSKGVNPYLGALNDITSPIFIISIVMFTVFFIFSKSHYSTIIWGLLRPIAGGYLLFLFIRIYPIEKRILGMKEGKYKNLLRETIKKIKE
jgi:hypothetical protein